jgi:flagellar hook-associated protein 2
MEITVGDRTVKFTLATGKNNLVGLRDKINSLGLGVTAAILTTETGAKPNYLSVSANATGSNTLTLTDDPDGTAAAWLTADNQGSNAKFKLNGVPVSKSSNLINDVAPGLTFQITGTTSNNGTVSLTMASDRSQLKSALQSFVSAYNSVSTEVDAQIGAAAGVLTGDPMVRQVQGMLRKLSDFEGSGSIANFAGLGLEMDRSGKLSLNSATFDGLGYSQLAAAYQLVGSGAEGLGSLQGEVDQLSDSVSGLLQIQIDEYNKSDQRLTDTISDLTIRNQITQLALQTKLQQADSLLAQLDSQQNVLTASLQSLTYALYGKVGSSS